MITTDNHDPVLSRLIQWGKSKDTVRAMLLTSTRAQPNAALDVFSDYDVVLVVRDIHPFFGHGTWLEDFGPVLVVYWDPIEPEPDFDIEQTGHVVQYADGLKVDFRIWPETLLQRIVEAPALPAELDSGYTILLDKDGRASRLRPPAYQAYIPARPDNDAYQKLIQDFFSVAPYVVKYLWRGELLPAKWCLDTDMKMNHLRPMLEWRLECDHGWSVPVRNMGKGLMKRLPPEFALLLAETYVGADSAENWDAILRTIALFRRVAVEVGNALGYSYPHELEQRVAAYVRGMKDVQHEPGS